MSYTPVELRHVRVGRRPFGYHRASVEQILSDVADSFETVWRDRGELADKVEQLEQELDELKRREQVLTNTLVAAEHAAEDLRQRAKREAELIVAEAHGEARAITRDGQSERERLLAETHRIEALLRSALGVMAEVGAATAPDAREDGTSERPRDESRELRQVAPAPVVAPAQPAAEAGTPDPGAEETRLLHEDDTPGWPPLRKVAQANADFDWGD